MAEKAKAEGNNFVKKLLSSNLTWSIVAFILLVIICTIFQHDFLALSWNSNTGGLAGPLITMLQESARYLMIATGMTLVISTAGIDLSVGSVMAVAGAAAMQTLSNGMNVWLSILIALAVGLAIGCVNGALVSFLGLQPFITTLIMMLAGRGMAKVITSGENTDASAVAGNEPLKWFANGFILGIPANFVIAVIIVILVGLLCRKTAMGMMIEAVGINQEASRMTGIKPKKILFLVYAISGFLAAIAGLFATASVMRVDVVKTGQDLEMYAILAVVIGGTSLLGGKFSLAGSAVGAVIIAMIRKTIITLGVNGVSMMDEDWFKTDYTALVQSIQAASPDTKIICNSIYPVENDYEQIESINNTNIPQANEWIKAVAEATGCKYADSASVLKAEDGSLREDYGNGDGIHLNADGFNAVLNYLRTHAYQ